MSAVGYPLVSLGIFIDEYNEEEREYIEDELERAYDLMFSGGLLTTIFWVWLSHHIHNLVTNTFLVHPWGFSHTPLPCYEIICHEVEFLQFQMLN